MSYSRTLQLGSVDSSRWLDWLLTSHPQRRLRLQISGVGALLMLACAGVLNLIARSVGTPPLAIYLWTIFSMGGLVAIFVLIRTGFSERWKDPSLTLPQIIYGIACNAVAYPLAGEARGIVPSILAVIFMFCMLGLSVPQICMVAIYALLAFGGAVAYVIWAAVPGQAVNLEIAHLVLIAVVLGGATFLTSRLQRLRWRLRQQKGELEAALVHIGKLATHDELTGLINRRLMNELLEQERQCCARRQSTFSVAIMDIDHFKYVNDQFGHRAGDSALRAFAEGVGREIRACDRLARWGGDEFLLLLPDTDGEAAVSICLARVLERMAALAIEHGGLSFNFTVSIGVSTYRDNEPIDQTIERADRALYAAKDGGRNRVVVV